MTWASRLAVVLLVVSLTALAPSVASAAKRGEICVFRAAVHDTPAGIVIGHLHDGARVHLLGTSASHRWYRIRGPLRLAGWTRRGNVCR
jgi:hypothetical protein